MRIFWSRATGGFYDEAIHGERQLMVDDEAAMAALEERLESLAFEADMEGEDSDAQAQISLILAAGAPKMLIDNPSCMIPPDAVEITRNRHIELVGELSDGKQLAADELGQPIAVDPQLSVEEQLEVWRRRRDQALKASDWTQLPDAMTAAKRKLWKEHRQALRDLPKIFEAAHAQGTLGAITFPEPPH